MNPDRPTTPETLNPARVARDIREAAEIARKQETVRQALTQHNRNSIEYVALQAYQTKLGSEMAALENRYPR